MMSLTSLFQYILFVYTSNTSSELKFSIIRLLSMQLLFPFSQLLQISVLNLLRKVCTLNGSFHFVGISFRDINWKRVRKYLSWGFINGICSSFWLMFLNFMIPGQNYIKNIGKVAIDQLLYAPVINFVFLSYCNWYDVNWCVWPLIQTVNFYFIYEQYQTIVIGICNFMWTIFLSINESSKPVEANKTKDIETQSTKNETVTSEEPQEKESLLH
ncbi:hypothetical protein WA158_002369 [Blastocystis sp. Blastoise]